MNDNDFIKLLQQSRPQAPAAPADEWQKISQKTTPLSLWLSRILRPGLAVGAGLAMAGLAFFVMPAFQSQPLSPADHASLEPFLAELNEEISGSESARPGDSYLALMDSVE